MHRYLMEKHALDFNDKQALIFNAKAYIRINDKHALIFNAKAYV